MIVLDGGLATTLQRRGLPHFTPVDAWVLDRPDEVVSVHRAFVDAGATVLLAGTFRALPHLSVEWRAITEAAVAIARAASAGRAEVWASLGPASTAHQRWSAAAPGDRARMAHGWAELAERCLDEGVDGIVLETFVDPAELVEALARVRVIAPGLPIATSLCPRDDGALWDGREPLPWLRRLQTGGADFIGFNCGTGPSSVEAAWSRCAGLTAARWAKPNRGHACDQALIAALSRLGASCDAVGGCCGVGPEVLAEWGRTRDPSALCRRKSSG
jgi:methionine synthase I (cobalamin-dependent)